MILSPSQIAELTALMRANGVETLEIAEGADSIRLVAAAGSAPAAPAAAAPASRKATSPGVGRFEPLAAPGQAVRAGQVLGTIATGLLRRPVTAPGAGTILRITAEPGSTADFGAPLFELT